MLYTTTSFLPALPTYQQLAVTVQLLAEDIKDIGIPRNNHELISNNSSKDRQRQTNKEEKIPKFTEFVISLQ